MCGVESGNCKSQVGQLFPRSTGRFIKQHGFPLVEEDGRTTLIFRGRADAVRLRHWIFGLPSAQDFSRVGESDLWHLTLDLPESSRIEYKLEISRGKKTRLIRDPLNERQAFDPFGSNSVLQTRGYEIPDWCLPDSEARPGKLEDISLKSRAFGDTREITLYLPARFRRVILIAADWLTRSMWFCRAWR